ncbi:hypothetical protein D9M69_506930 [compost metagenome]
MTGLGKASSCEMSSGRIRLKPAGPPKISSPERSFTAAFSLKATDCRPSCWSKFRITHSSSLLSETTESPLEVLIQIFPALSSRRV